MQRRKAAIFTLSCIIGVHAFHQGYISGRGKGAEIKLSCFGYLLAKNRLHLGNGNSFEQQLNTCLLISLSKTSARSAPRTASSATSRKNTVIQETCDPQSAFQGMFLSIFNKAFSGSPETRTLKI